MNTSRILRLVLFCSVIAMTQPGVWGEDQTGDDVNVALGRPYTLTPHPGYEHCQDAGDKVQLTDGEYSAGYFWTNKGTVGWVSSGFGCVTIDLGQIEPISGAAFRTAAGTAGVEWPSAIHVLVSDAGEVFRDVGDLVALDQAESGPLPDDGYAVRRLVTHRLQTRGRFVRFLAIWSGPYGFVDEVEVFRGPAVWKDRAAQGPVMPSEPAACFGRLQVSSKAQRRFSMDSRHILGEVDSLPADQLPLARQLRDELSRTVNQWATEQLDLDNFQTRLPLSPTHSQLFSVQAQLWHVASQEELTACVANPWDPLDLYTLPTEQPATAKLTVDMMSNEYRAATVNLANSSNAPLHITCRVTGVPAAPTPDYLTMYQVVWTDTSSGQPVAAALEPMPQTESGWQMTLQPGLPGQLWLTFHSVDLKAGTYNGQLELMAPSRVVRLPVTLTVYPLQLPDRTSLMLGGWSYTNGSGSRGVTQNRQALIHHLQQHFVTAPWATSSVLGQARFHGDGSVDIDTQQMDQWLADWPDATRYNVFVDVGTSCGGAAMGTDRFRQNVARWIHAWVSHLADNGVSADQLGLLLRDEPHEGTDISPIVAWSPAIRAAEPDVVVWEDPTYADPAKAPAELWDACDVICPNRVAWLAGSSAFHNFYLQQQKAGKTLQFYSCSGPARLLDPYSYYRLQAWQCWQVGATGTYFWAFGDNGGVSSWNEYAVKGSAFTPLFLDASGVTPGKQMEAIRESVEDYEYLVMLRASVAAAETRQVPAAQIEPARRLLVSAASRVLDADGCQDIFWHRNKDRTQADAVRREILIQLTKLSTNQH